MRLLCPRLYVSSVQQIDLKGLKNEGIKGIITDLDNTLVPWNEDAHYPEAVAWLQKIKDAGFAVCIVSNNHPRRAKTLAGIIDVPFIWQAVKPRRHAFRQALRLMNLKPAQVAVVGDQVFTDILGGNRLGLYAILVRPLKKQEFIGTRLVRQVEKLILFSLRRRGYLQ
ncbi:MAG: YqeG family HAD IIIA-type phosphatase [Bacillota bacterium]